MYRDTLALKMNPFVPNFPPEPSNVANLPFLADLDKKPLRIDKCPDLLTPLLCQSILDLDTHMGRFHELMEERGYAFGEHASRAMNSALIVIRGAVGSGKTTLGAWMIAEMARLPGEPWHVDHLPDHETERDWLAALERVDNRIAAVPPGTHVAVLVDNVSQSRLNAVVGFFNKLDSWPRLFVVTTHNLELLDKDDWLRSGAAAIEDFTLRQITPADADAYVAHRLPQYRDPKREEIDALSAVFPFATGSPGRLVQREVDLGATPVVLRMLNTHFNKKLAEHARKLRNRQEHVPVGSVAAEALADYLLPED